MRLKTIGMVFTTAFTMMMSAFMVSAADTTGVEISEVNFPDTVFREYVSTNFDSDTDGMLSETEIGNVTSINVNGKRKVSSLEGIEYFTELEDLQCIGAGITSLDVSKNVKLDTLVCYSTDIASLDVSKNAALKYLDCYSTKITSLDVSQNTELTYLRCIRTGITSLDVSKNVGLEILFCGDTGITSLDVSKNVALKQLGYNSTGITNLDVSNNTELEALYCNETGITSLDVSKNTGLKILNCSSTDITKLDISKNVALINLNCSKTEITSLDVSNNTALVTLECGGNKIAGLDVSNNIALKNLNVDYNECYIGKIASEFELSSLLGFDVTKASDWNGATYSDGRLTNFTKNYITYNYDCGNGYVVKLKLIAADEDMAISEMYFPDAEFREYVSSNFDSNSDGILSREERATAKFIMVYGTDKADGGITSLEGIEYFPELISVVCYYNAGLTSIDVGNNRELNDLNCSNTGINSLDVSNNTELEVLYCRATGINSLDVSKNAVLEYLDCSETRITSLDVSNNEKLQRLLCNETGITSLDLRKNTKLSELQCGNSKLTSLNLTKNTSLNKLVGDGNVFNIGKVGSSYNLSGLPGFDAAKASDWSGATYTDGKLVDFTDTKVTYNYNCGKGFMLTFTLEAELVVVDTTIYDGVDYSAVYNYDYYISKYPEITGSAIEYFVTVGIPAGHQASEEFSLLAYKSNYPDLGVAFGNDNAKYYEHYINNGKAEGRNATVVLVESETKYYGVEYADVYNYDYYINNNPDLKAAFGDNKAAALIHFANMGMKEGRQACEDFGAKIYKFNYPELQASFGEDMTLYYHHYMNYGKAEGRNGATRDFSAYCVYEGVNYTPVYNYEDYIERNPDVFDAYGLDANAVLKHFVTVGMAEGRQGSDDFNYNIYRSNYPDLEVAFGEDRAEYYHHYINSGYNEGRNAATSDYTSDTVYAGVDYADVYSYDYYVTANPDVAAAIGDNRIAILAHFVRNGMAEGRQGSAEFNVRVYMENNPDLVEKFGNDLKAYYMHYIEEGKAAGRVAN